MSELMVSPLLDAMEVGECFASHDGVSCYNIRHPESGREFVLKHISVPATQDQVEALLLTGAYTDKDEADAYYRKEAEGLIHEAEERKKLLDCPYILPFLGVQMEKKEEGVGYDVYAVLPKRNSLQKYLEENAISHLRGINMGIDLCVALAALREEGYGEEEIERAVSCFHGNVGMCSRYIMDEKLRKLVDLTKALTDSIIRKDEYGLNCAFYSVGSERENVRNVLSMTDKLFRDAAVLAKDSDAKTISCFPDGAARLSQTITAYQSARIHYKLEKAWDAVQHNVSVPLVLAGLCAEMMEIVS